MLKPILDKLEEGNRQLAVGTKLLNQLQAEQEACEKKAAALNEESAACQKKKDETQDQLNTNRLRLIRAKKLLGGLADEKSRWEEEVKRLR